MCLNWVTTARGLSLALILLYIASHLCCSALGRQLITFPEAISSLSLYGEILHPNIAHAPVLMQPLLLVPAGSMAQAWPFCHMVLILPIS